LALFVLPPPGHVLKNDQLQLGTLTVAVVRKNIKNIHLRVTAPEGEVKISAPTRMQLDTIRKFAQSKLQWIQKHQQNLQNQPRFAIHQFQDQEIHYVWGKPYRLRIIARNVAPYIELIADQMILHVRPRADQNKRQAIVDRWYLQQVKAAAPALIAKWEQPMGVKVAECYIRKMKSRWGSCTPSNHRIRLNSDLAQKPPACLEYVVVHELVHLLEPSHNARFKALMTQFMPDWRSVKKLLNAFPLPMVDGPNQANARHPEPELI
jgi:predicted metal-dependent hydrolase